MSSRSLKLNSSAALMAAIAAAYPLAGLAAPAAQVDFTVGNVTAIGAGGKSRALTKGAKVEQGETITTNNGRAQLRFTDGAYVSLQPESEFRIDQYRYDGKQDGTEKGFFSLVKGGLRTITGLVGRTNKNNYQVTTSVATIGIRGTEYTIQYGQSVTGTVGEGEINVCNGAGCLSVTNGESYYVQNDGVKPTLTNKRTDLPPAPPQSPPPEFKESENVSEDGDPCVLFPAQCIPGRLTGTVNAILGYVVGSPNVEDPASTTLENGSLISHAVIGAVSGPVVDVGGDGIIVWGRAGGATGAESGAPLHYVVGLPVTETNGVVLSNMQATYTLLGGTSPTGFSDGKTGLLDSMSMAVDFQQGSVSGSMKWFFEPTNSQLPLSSTNGKTITASFGGSFDGTPFFGSGTTFGPSGASGSMSIQGFVSGANAERAGVVYSLSNSALSQGYAGAAALKQTSLSIAPVQ